MKIILLLLLFMGPGYPQHKPILQKKHFLEHLNEVEANVTKTNYKKIYPSLIEECENYLKKHPNSELEPDLLSHIFYMKLKTSSDHSDITSTAVKLLKFDHTKNTRENIAENLIEKGINFGEGIKILKNLLPSIKEQTDYYKINILIAKAETEIKNYTAAEKYFTDAERADSTKMDAYMGLLQAYYMSGEKDKYHKLSDKIAGMQRDKNINANLSKLKIKDIHNREIDFSKLKGEPVVLTFFRFGCHYCQKDMPMLKALAIKHPRVHFVFVYIDSISAQARKNALQSQPFAFLKNRSLAEYQNKFDNLLSIDATPLIMVIDNNSIVRFDYRGYSEKLISIVEKDLRGVGNSTSGYLRERSKKMWRHALQAHTSRVYGASIRLCPWYPAGSTGWCALL